MLGESSKFTILFKVQSNLEQYLQSAYNVLIVRTHPLKWLTAPREHQRFPAKIIAEIVLELQIATKKRHKWIRDFWGEKFDLDKQFTFLREMALRRNCGQSDKYATAFRTMVLA